MNANDVFDKEDLGYTDCTDLAEKCGVSRDSLYYHIKKINRGQDTRLTRYMKARGHNPTAIRSGKIPINLIQIIVDFYENVGEKPGTKTLANHMEIGINVDRDEYQKLREVAGREGRTCSDLIREAITKLINEAG